ncbi:unnamed protein product, partial [Phaeothamnion confervicola]
RGAASVFAKTPTTPISGRGKKHSTSFAKDRLVFDCQGYDRALAGVACRAAAPVMEEEKETQHEEAKTTRGGVRREEPRGTGARMPLRSTSNKPAPSPAASGAKSRFGFKPTLGSALIPRAASVSGSSAPASPATSSPRPTTAAAAATARRAAASAAGASRPVDNSDAASVSTASVSLTSPTKRWGMKHARSETTVIGTARQNRGAAAAPAKTPAVRLSIGVGIS